MSNIGVYKGNYENRGTGMSYKCRTAITFKVKVQVAVGYAFVQTGVCILTEVRFLTDFICVIPHGELWNI